jgi:hypothetical protein
LRGCITGGIFSSSSSERDKTGMIAVFLPMHRV